MHSHLYFAMDVGGFRSLHYITGSCYKIQFKKSILGRDVVEGGGFWLKGGYRGKIEVR